MQLPTNINLFDSVKMDFKCPLEKESRDYILLPVSNLSHSIMSSETSSSCISSLDIGSKIRIQRGFLSDFGVENLFGDTLCTTFHNCKPSSDDQSSTIGITRTGSALKAEIGIWVEDSYSKNCERVQPGKVTKKRARPGESTRPRPKDRKLIEARVKELREIVPNGAKCSIGSLLDRTIKHMLFLQGVTKYSDTIKQISEPKMIHEDNGVIGKENSSGNGGGAATQSMFCPVVVEDLNSRAKCLKR